ncbi:hypothetical protein JCM33374_g4719 [Metschnikowia sp. JCM 33374]|nr:hypothetical protein JCM33374_g4719 [Metschnikowia sp. JCM 33374]
MSLDSLISPEQIPYEESLLQDTHNETLWLEYVETCGSDFHKAVFILDRAVSELPASTLLWNTYLQLPWGSQHKDQLLKLYERALVVLYDTPAFWIKYVDLLHVEKSEPGRARLRKALDMALFSLDRTQHPRFWDIYLSLADEMANTDAAAIYARFFEVSSDELPNGPARTPQHCVLKVAEYGDYTQALNLFQTLAQANPRPSRSHAEFVLDFLQLLSAATAFRADAFVEKTARNAALDTPELAKRYFLAVAAYHSARQALETARHFHALAFEAATSVSDIIEVFDIVSNWEENQLEKLYESQAYDELKLRMRSFRRLLDVQPVLVNDVLIKAHPHCVDHWLERASIYQEKQNPAEVIGTYVAAIRRVNPLKATSTHGNTMASLWIKYAEIYISQEDLSTANVIFSHAVKSQFRTPEELAQLYIAWTEMIFMVSDDEALQHLEQVLFVPPSEATPDKLSPSKASSKEEEYAEKKSVHAQLFRNGTLWGFYVDMLKAMIEEDHDNSRIYQKLGSAYAKLLALQIISIRSLLDYADFLDQHEGQGKSFVAYEAGIRNFKSPQAQYHIWHVYLDKAIQSLENDEQIRDLFDRCLSSEMPGFHACDIYMRYFNFEMARANVVRAVKIIREAIAYLTRTFSLPRYTRENRNKIADDKFVLYSKVASVVLGSLHDNNLYRDFMTEALQDGQLPLARSIDLGLEFIQFETNQKEVHRTRALFRYLAGLGHPDAHVMKKVWQKWQEWEVDSGTEESYKQLLKARRQILNEYKDVKDIKSDINPMGFVMAEAKPVTTTEDTAAPKNPDVIELDMDM